MFYVVCVYIVVCGLALVFLPTKMTDERAKKGTIFDSDEPIKCPDEDIDEKVNELLKDIPDLTIGE